MPQILMSFKSSLQNNFRCKKANIYEIHMKEKICIGKEINTPTIKSSGETFFLFFLFTLLIFKFSIVTMDYFCEKKI